MLRRISFIFLLFFSVIANADGVAGLTYDFYRGTGAQPSIDPLVYPTVVKTGVSPTISYSGAWGGTSTVLDSGYWDRFIVHWYGYINVPTTGTYTFGATADDGVIVKVNNTQIISGWYDSGNALRTATPITLTAGTAVPIEIWYYENGGGQAISFYYLNTSNSWTLVPTTWLATDTTYWAAQAPAYSSGITSAQQTRKNSETTQRLNQSGNEIQIEQIGDNNNITIRQGITLGGKNRIELYSNGDSNTYNLNQGYTTGGTVSANDGNNHYLYLNVTGSNNTITKQQTGTTNFNETTVNGNTNNLTNIQQGNSPKILFQSVSGNNNTVTTNQKDGGQHYLDISLTGNGHSVNATQEGAGNHAATINFTNSGGASSLNLNQTGTANQTYSIQQSCTNPAGCATTITQP